MWKCNSCGKINDSLEVVPGESGGQVVDILDYWCKHCGSANVTFTGSKDEENAYWDKEWGTPPVTSYKEVTTQDELVNHEPFITVYKRKAGWKAVMSSWDENTEAYDAWVVSELACNTKEEAYVDARKWAKDDNMALLIT